ncbi:MAG: molybdenum cofactor biosynthesis protein MoaE, partial [Bryobacteraceae bacterium]
MTITILFFGFLRDIVGAGEVRMEVEPGATLGSVFDHFAGLYPQLEQRRSSIMLARNQQFGTPPAELKPGDEVAFLPPVSGGAPEYTRAIEDGTRGFFALTRTQIDTASVARRVLQPRDGALVTFEGVARDNSAGRKTLYLEYDGYEAMAIKVLAELGAEIAGAHDLTGIAMVHRLGRIEIGEASVVIAVSAPHREAAFDAAREGIDRLKKRVPIWKKEYFVDGEVWV